MEQTPDEATASLNDENAPQEHATRFYDRIRRSIHSTMEKKGRAVEKMGEFLLLVPDVFILLWRLAKDSRVTGKDKVLLGSALAYFIVPFDFMPEALIGPIGYLDDLVFAVYTLNKILTSTSEDAVREHWSGSEDVLAMMQRVLRAADSLIGTDVFNKVKKMIHRD